MSTHKEINMHTKIMQEVHSAFKSRKIIREIKKTIYKKKLRQILKRGSNKP